MIDDDVEGETLLGDGRAGLMVKEREDSLKHTSGMNRPKSKMRGMPGPIASNTEVGQDCVCAVACIIVIFMIICFVSFYKVYLSDNLGFPN